MRVGVPKSVLALVVQFHLAREEEQALRSRLVSIGVGIRSSLEQKLVGKGQTPFRGQPIGVMSLL